MPDENESLVRQAYEAYGRGDVTQILELVDPDLEWTYLDPSFEDPEPQTCHAGTSYGRRCSAGPSRA